MRLHYLFCAALLSAAPFFGAAAEPQILGLLAQNEPIPLNCGGGECYAEFSSFCMEPDRSSPSHQTAYTPTGGTDLTLVATLADGGKVRLPVEDLATFNSIRGFAAVRVSVPEKALMELGARAIALEVGERVSLLPVPRADYRRPHEPDEIAQTVGPGRIMGQRIVDRGGPRADAALLVSRLLNALPEWGRVSDEVRDGVWHQAIEVAGLTQSGGRGLNIARQAYKVCRSKDPDETRFTFRQCLEGRHDRLIWSLNRNYWTSVTGS